MPAVGRVGDIGVGTCTAHPNPVGIQTVLITGSPTVLTNGQLTGYIGSIGVCTCGHNSVALTGASTVKATGIGVHRLGDIGQPPGGNYAMITGSPNTISGV